MPITFVRKSKVVDDAILQAAAGMEKKLSAAFLRAVEAFKGTVNMTKLTEALAAHDSNAAMAILGLDKGFSDALMGKGLSAGVQSFRDALQATYAAGAKAAINQLPSRVSIELSFNLMSPEAISHLAAYDFGLIQQISSQTVETIREVITNAFTVGGSPAQQARQIREVIGLTANQEAAVANFREALETGNLRAAMDRALRDGRYDRTLLRNARNGTALDQAQVDKMVSRYNERFLNYRATTVARTESIRASNKGQQEAWSQAQTQGLLPKTVQRVWIVSGDDDTCSECEDLDGETAGIGEEFAPGIMEPPDPHPSCRCTTALDL